MNKKIILITGARGSGKSTALAGIVPATEEEWKKVLVFDSEDSWSDLATEKGGKFYLKDLNFEIGAYIRAYDRFRLDSDLLKQIADGKLPWVSQQQKSSLLGYYEYFVNIINEKLSAGKFRYVFIDTIEPIEAALTAWAEVNKNLSGWSGQRAYGRLETEAVRPIYENLLEGIGRRGVEYIGVTSHLKQPWVGDKPVMNKVEPGGRLKLLMRIGSMAVWLVKDGRNIDGAPAGLILKSRNTRLMAVNGRMKARQVLPERMPHFSWADVEEYEQNPANLESPAQGEKMSAEEREMISEMMNDAQMKLMLISAEQDLAREQGNTVEFPSASTEPLSLPERLRLAKLNGGTVE